MRPPAVSNHRNEPCDHLWMATPLHAANPVTRAFETHFSNFLPASRALLLSQAGQHSARAFQVMRTKEDVAFFRASFGFIFPRRNACSCRRLLDAQGDQWAACATAHAVLMEGILARVCRETGALCP